MPTDPRTTPRNQRGIFLPEYGWTNAPPSWLSCFAPVWASLLFMALIGGVAWLIR